MRIWEMQHSIDPEKIKKEARRLIKTERKRQGLCPNCGGALFTRYHHIIEKGHGHDVPVCKMCYSCNTQYPLLTRKEEEQMVDREKELGTNLLGSIKALIREELGAREDANSREPLSEFDCRSGRKWGSEEEDMLIHEMTSFIHQAAAMHRRTVKAISMRVEELYKRGRFCDL